MKHWLSHKECFALLVYVIYLVPLFRSKKIECDYEFLFQIPRNKFRKQEILSLLKLDSPYIVCTFGILWQNNFILLLMEYAGTCKFIKPCTSRGGLN